MIRSPFPFKMPTHITCLMALTSTILPIFAQSQTTFSPGGESLRLFNIYRPIIERINKAIVDDPVVLVGDINGDGKEDCIISFIMTSKDGGNAIIRRETAI